jgi:DNA helicase-4
MDLLTRLVLQQADDRVRLVATQAEAVLLLLPDDAPPAAREELQQLYSGLLIDLEHALAAVTRQDASAAMKGAVHCEKLFSAMKETDGAIREPSGWETLLAAREAAVREEQQRREVERRQIEEEAERERRRREELEALQAARDGVRRFFEERAYDESPVLPDDEQADVIRHDGSHLLVTARAGAGKTRALALRATYLIEHRGVDPDGILLLAFNRKAADEIRDRLEKLGDRVPHVLTFHALARSMMGSQGEILTDDEDDQGYSRLREHLAGITSVLEAANPLFGGQLRRLMLALARDDADESRSSWQTVNGMWVDSREQKRLWDFLFEHGYQPTYARGVKAPAGLGKPLLTILAGSRQLVLSFGSVDRADLDDLFDGKQTFLELEAPRVGETREAMQQRWRQRLQAVGLALAPLTDEQLWQRVQLSLRREFLREVTSYVMRMRNQGLDPEARTQFVARHQATDAIERLFLDLAERIYLAYERQIASGALIDFQEVLLVAARQIEHGQTGWKRRDRSGDVRRLRHLMIDEFQDVSPLFMRLVKAMCGVNRQLLVMGVGDDWQAINGFAGATTAYFENFATHFRGASQLTLRTNYRSGRRIVTAGNAVMEDRGTPARPFRSHDGRIQEANIAHFTRLDGEQELSLRIAALRRTVAHHVEHGRSVALLTRTRQPAGLGAKWLEEIRRDLPPEVTELVSGTTVHQFKGKQAQVVILVDAGERAFPLIGPTWPLFRIFGDSHDVLVEAERRLLYVAVTRAEDELQLVVDGDANRGSLSPLFGRAADDVPLLRWDAYSPPGISGRTVCLVDVANLSSGWQNEGGTVPLKEYLRTAGYSFGKEPMPRWSRATVMPHEGVNEVVDAVQQEVWARLADRVLVTFSEGGRERAVYSIMRGRWTLLDNR